MFIADNWDVNTIGSQRSQIRPLAAPVAREALRSTPAAAAPAAAPRSTGSSSFTASPSRAGAATMTRLGSLFAPEAPKAAPAPRAAEVEQTVRAGATPGLAIADNSKVESTLRFDEELTLKGGKVNVDIPHSYRGDLVVTRERPTCSS